MINIQQIVDNLFKDINRIRTNPINYAHNLARKQSLYAGDIYKPKGKYIQTKEGINALRDACFELQKTQQLAPLIWSFALHVLADQQALYIGSNGLTKGDRALSDRVPKYALATGRINEIIQLGGTSSQEIFHELVIDDGLITRRRRKTILDPNYRYVGIATAKHQNYGYCTVFIFAEQIHQLLKPTKELVQLETQKHQKKGVDPNQNYYKMKKPPVLNQVKHFKRSRVVTPPPPPSITLSPSLGQTLPPSVRSLKNSQISVHAIAQPAYQTEIIEEIIQPVQFPQPTQLPQLIQAPVIIQQQIPIMTTSGYRYSGAVTTPLITSIPNTNAIIIHEARSSSEPGLLVTPPAPYGVINSQQDYRGTIIHPPQHVQVINRLSHYRPPQLVEPAQNTGMFDRCTTSNCLLF